jgi:hypothetical protein
MFRLCGFRHSGKNFNRPRSKITSAWWCAIVAWVWIYSAKYPLCFSQEPEDHSSKSKITNSVIFWNQRLLEAIVATHAPPTVAARSLAILHTCTFDAWSAYTPHAESFERETPRRRPKEEWTSKNKSLAVSYAAYRALSDLFPSQAAPLAAAAYQRHVDPYNFTADPSTPEGIGNTAAAAVLIDRHKDGSNQLGELHPGAYSDYTSYAPVNTPELIIDPDRWQPLSVTGANGLTTVQSFVTPQWGRVTTFADIPYEPGTGPTRYATDPKGYIQQASYLVHLSANLTDEQKIIAEYWALGSGTVTPPGRWFEFAQFVSQRDHHSLDDDAQMFFILGNAMLDSSVICWRAKRQYDSERPITAVHYLYAGTLIEAWAGPSLGTRWIDGGEWQPYQQTSTITPAFPEFFSGHSTFSAAAAEILTLWTGDDDFGSEYVAPVGSSLIEPGSTPAKEVQLHWDTFRAAADQAGMSRRYGGIHFEQGDLEGRVLGRIVAQRVWAKVQHYIGAERY